MPAALMAVEAEIDGLWYELVSKANMRGAKVIQYKDTPYSGDIVIPAEVEYEGLAYSVTSIGEFAFSYCTGLTSITIPSSVTLIGNQAFVDCSGLTSVYISDLEAWCKISFGYDSNPLSYAHHLYLNGEEVKDLIIPNTVTRIGSSAFSGCTSLTSVTIPSSVTSIGYDAFFGCTSLTSVTIPSSVTSIEYGAFLGCTSLTSVTIPSSVTSIGDVAFAGCTSLTSITIPSSVTLIGNQAFEGCTGLSSITIPSSVTSIGDLAFSGCTELTDVYCYAETVPNTNSNAFDGSYIEYSTLHVPASAIESYRTTAPWSGFGKIVAIDDEEATSGEFRYHGQPLEDGAVITIPSEIDPVWGDIECNTNPVADAINGLVFANTSSKEMKCTAKLTIESNTMNPSQIKWCMGGQCTLVTGTTISKDFTTKAGGVTMVQFDCLPTRDGALDALLEVTSNMKTYTVRIRFVNNAPEPSEQCAKPLIYYNDGQLLFTSETEGANFSYTIKDTDVKSGLASVVDLSVTYTIEVRATKAGFADSDVATATICWIDVEPQKEGISDDEVVSVKEMKAQPVLIQRSGNGIAVTGAPAGTPIAVYDLSGQLLGCATATAETTRVQALNSEKVVVVKIGERAVKVAK